MVYVPGHPAAWKGRSSRRIRQMWVPLSEISSYAVKVVIIAEDDKFWSNEGFDLETIRNTIEKDLQKGRFNPAGSTI